jgi:SagB-type dehydrogenase family enzyme
MWGRARFKKWQDFDHGWYMLRVHGRTVAVRHELIFQIKGVRPLMYLLLPVLLLVCCLVPGGIMAQSIDSMAIDKVALPRPSLIGEAPLEQLLSQRRSVRDYSETTLSLAEVGQLLWAAQGITHAQDLRTAPSAGALYPLELYVVVARVEGLAVGVYHYEPVHHRLQKTIDDEVSTTLARAALSQHWIEDAAAVIVFTADYARTTRKYGKRGRRYVHMEVGHAAQNVFLQAGALDLATVTVGAFNDDAVARLLRIPSNWEPLLLMPVGKKQ